MYTFKHINKNDKLKINYFTQNQQNLTGEMMTIGLHRV